MGLLKESFESGRGTFLGVVAVYLVNYQCYGRLLRSSTSHTLRRAEGTLRPGVKTDASQFDNASAQTLSLSDSGFLHGKVEPGMGFRGVE